MTLDRDWDLVVDQNAHYSNGRIEEVECKSKTSEPYVKLHIRAGGNAVRLNGDMDRVFMSQPTSEVSVLLGAGEPCNVNVTL
eukprot:5791898-Amphidinium_carterae.2